ncbi:MAG: ABC transporter permease [Pirellulales bacterium]|nr:ABC transporter permease [Pirellulales bacterium]
MSLWKIAWRSIQQRALASALTALGVGLGVALVVAVLVIHGVIDRSFKRGSQGYDLIVGPKGSSLQLVLNTVFHLSESIGTIPYSYYEELNEGRFSSAVETAVPVCVGHDYKGSMVVATIPDMFDKLTYLNDRRYEFAEGRNFDLAEPFEAVAGSVAARKTGLKVGDTFVPKDAQQDVADPDDHAHQSIKIVGILAHTGTPNDRAIFMNVEGFYRFGCHTAGPTLAAKLMKPKTEPAEEKSQAKDERAEAEHKPGEEADKHGEDAPDRHGDEARDHAAHGHVHGVPYDQRQVSAVLVCTDMSKPQLAMQLGDLVNADSVAQAVAPSKVISQLFEGIVGNVQLMLLILACLVVIVAGVGILVSIYNSMSDRRHEIAVMRALGASRVMVGTIILLESILLSLGGGALGILLGHGLVGVLGPTIAEQTGVLVSPWSFQYNELILIPGLVVLASIVGYLPAAVAYRTDVAKSLTTAQ